ncbi:MAG TPA: HPr(Ser) kinase/phosphatase [Longimicrobiales bacterium]|nr:HPr(Ser) kinase/phosphatase [Longimicrobiales bacterium]
MTRLTVEEVFLAKRETLRLELVTPECPLDRIVESPTISSPGLVLAGFRDRYLRGRLQVLGETEVRYLHSLGEEQQRQTLDAFLQLQIPALFVTKGLSVPPVLEELAVAHCIPLIRSKVKTADFYRRIQPYLEERFAPSMTAHGSLADVYGVGLLFIGRSGIGKSECVLDLVERGHRLVADDVVQVTRRGNDVLIGQGHELQQHHMEIRGIGIVDIRALFGIRSIRQQKRIEVVVQLVDWDDRTQYDRTGLETEEMEMLGVQIPKVVIPLNAGKNITVISEVIAMNHLLKYSGVHSAKLFNERLMDSMKPVRAYLEEDYE